MILQVKLQANTGRLMEMFEAGIKVAEVDITHMTAKQIAAIVALQEGMNRTFTYKTINPYEFPDLSRGKE